MTVRMKEWAHGWAICLFGFLMITASPAFAETPAAILYDVTEVMSVTKGRVPHRVAEGALAGTSKLGTPLCPHKVAKQLATGSTECWVVAKGADDINLDTGLGTLSAEVTAVTTGDNPFAAPELSLASVSLAGSIDFSPALAGMPYGTVAGLVDGRKRFRGVFLQPFLGSTVIDDAGTTLRQYLCPWTPNPKTSLGGPDFAWIEVSAGVPTGTCIDIQPNQMSLGYPTLRFDLFFD
jgi:hypothetical protein